ncbi:MAG: hypothetical protein QXJ51_03325 [Sulfolobales archaeon]
MKKAIVLDTAGLFIAQALSSYGELWTVPEAVEEVLDEDSRRGLENMIEAGRIRIDSPPRSSIEEVRRIAAEKDFEEALSDVDLKIVALAYELRRSGFKPIIYSDDSFVHRLARAIGIECVSIKRVVRGGGRIKIYVCDVCGFKTYKYSDRCPVCGSRLRISYK